MKKLPLVASFAAGLIFSVGLCLSGMTNPAKVLGFLDIFGRWDPAVALVMMAAISTSAVGYRLIMRRKQPVLAERFSLPVKQTLDTPLILGSAVFGVGFGLSGYCAGPVVASLATGALPAIVFTAGMLAGFIAQGWFEKATPRPAAASAAGSRP